jgi:predicted dehydrogenase
VVRVGFIGVGGIAGEHLKNLEKIEQAVIVAVCDIIKDNADKVAAQTGAKSYTDLDTMLDNEKIDVLFVCVPPFAHGEIEEKAASRGIHLLVEKPLGLDMNVVRKKAEVLRKSGIIVGTGYCLRYLNTLTQAKEYLQGKTIALVRAYRFGGLPESLWWRDMNKSGGQLVEMTTHNVDMMRFLVGEVKKISADMALRLLNDEPGMSIPDVTSVNLLFESGAIGHIDTSCIPQPDGRSSLEIMGRDFRLTINGTSLTIWDQEQNNTYKSDVNMYLEQDKALIEAIITGNRSLILAPYEEALKTLEVTLAANESAKSGQSVFLSY